MEVDFNMKQYMVYECENCGYTSRNRDDILRCEASHLNISVEIMLEWDDMKQKVRHLSAIRLGCCNEQTRYDFDNAVEKLIAFEKENNIHET